MEAVAPSFPLTTFVVYWLPGGCAKRPANPLQRKGGCLFKRGHDILIAAAGEGLIDRTKTTSFEMLSDQGEVVGYIKTWHDEDDYAGFVHFDSEGNIVDWKAFSKSSSH